MAVPHISGAIAILRAARPNASVDKILEALSTSGKPIFDARTGLTRRRINVRGALARLGVTGLSPTTISPRPPVDSPEDTDWFAPIVDLILD